ncbi:hypothetical protein O8B93_20845 [Agrobacterium rhizogenes]|uniref:hypothetical protein n=1 Tax=Rhizobium rhizogenes TaxID=359 RepID=UPI0022B74209|nr:hypothetical protein [Rhizobium rhizogenes]MCZ7450036.1 hypothetical protein [Rhizobium rhizogenes]
MKNIAINFTLIAILLSSCTQTDKENAKYRLSKTFANVLLGADVATQVWAADAEYKALNLNKAYVKATATSHPISHRPADKAFGKLADYVVELRDIEQRPDIGDVKQAGLTKQVNMYLNAKRPCSSLHVFVKLFDEPVPLYDPATKRAGILIKCMTAGQIKPEHWLMPIDVRSSEYGPKLGIGHIAREKD